MGYFELRILIFVVAAWKYSQVYNIVTCFSSKDFPGFIQTFAIERSDFIAAVVEQDSKRLVIINCHQICSGLSGVQQYMVNLFAVVLGSS
uniref:Uncharacterized protein n=1 Tax=Tetranychus urticae TaxID=32264 RepID=T1KKT2_TETUR